MSASQASSPGPRIGYWDIETSPNIADVWGLFDQTISLSQLRESTRMIAFGWKWRGEKVQFFSEYHHGTDAMLYKLHRFMDEADAVVHYNGDRFDVPHANREFVEHGMTPPSPAKNVDLFKVVKKNFRFPSNKLQYVSERLLGDSKVQHTGHSLWRDCLGEDEDRKKRAWNLMRKYCKQDVALLEPLHDKLTPWLGNQLNIPLFDPEGGDTLRCQKCGSDDLESRGVAYTVTRAYPQYRCRKCGGWTRDGKSSWSVSGSGSVR